MNAAQPANTKADDNSNAASDVTASPSPPNAGAPQAFRIEERVVWTDEHTSYGGAQRLFGPADLDGSLAKRRPEWIAAVATKISNRTVTNDLKTGLPRSPSPECAAWSERILATYALGQEPPALDVPADAAAAHLLDVASIAPYLLARGSARFLAEVLLAAYDVTSVWYGGQGGSGRYFETGKGTGMGVTVQIARWMRAAFDAKAHEATRGIFEKARMNAPLDLRIAIAIATGDTDWAREDAAELLAAKKTPLGWEAPGLLFEVLRDPALCTRLAERYPRSVPVFPLAKELGLAAAPAIAVTVERDPSSAWNATALSALECVVAAKALAQTLAKKNNNEVAKAYYQRRPDLGLIALAPLVAAEGKLAPFAKPELDAIVRANPSLPSQLADQLDPKSRALFTRTSAEAAKPANVAAPSAVPPVLAVRPAPRKAQKSGATGKVRELPEFAAAARLPSVLLRSGEALPETAVNNLLAILQQSALNDPDPALKEVRKACDAKSLSAFAWGLFEAWLAASGSSKEGWGFTTLGLLGDDDTARRITPYIRAWPGESQHARAVTGLGILEAIGTDVALMFLHGVSQKVKFKGLQDKARAKIAAIAEARGLTSEELADRLVPDLGLNDSGSLTLDFGPRTFTVGFDEHLNPLVRDAAGKVLSNLPKPSKSDDAEKANAAAETWKTLKKDAKTVASGQITRFELAMCSQHRWKADGFLAFIVGHPLVVHLARRVVLGVFDGAKLSATFRVSEDRTLADANDAPVTLANDARVGVVHRLELDEALLARWGQILADYEILQPFDQLGRAVYTPSDTERSASVMARMNGVTVKTGKVLGLEHRGWRKGPAEDAGWVYTMEKRLANGFEATLGFEGGICMGYMEGTPSDQKLGGVGVRRSNGKEAKLGELSATAFSELVRDVELLRE